MPHTPHTDPTLSLETPLANWRIAGNRLRNGITGRYK